MLFSVQEMGMPSVALMTQTLRRVEQSAREDARQVRF